MHIEGDTAGVSGWSGRERLAQGAPKASCGRASESDGVLHCAVPCCGVYCAVLCSGSRS